MKFGEPLTRQQQQIKSLRADGRSIYEVSEALNLQTRAIRDFLANENVKVIEKANHENHTIPTDGPREREGQAPSCQR